MTVPTVKNMNINTESGKDVMLHLFAESVSNVKLSFEITKQPAHGAFALDPSTGHLQYHSHPSFVGHDLVSYIAVDESGNESAQADIFIDVKPLNSPKVVEIAIEIPANPTLTDIVEALAQFADELDALLNGEQTAEDSGV